VAFNALRQAYAARHGISQYADIGAGLPTSPNVHETARTVIPDARVVYIDNDPVAVTNARHRSPPTAPVAPTRCGRSSAVTDRDGTSTRTKREYPPIGAAVRSTAITTAVIQI